MSCSHGEVKQIWVEKEDGNGGWYGEWITETRSTTVDIDTHRYRCTRCGLVMYYSGRAREHYESGKPGSFDPFA